MSPIPRKQCSGTSRSVLPDSSMVPSVPLPADRLHRQVWRAPRSGPVNIDGSELVAPRGCARITAGISKAKVAREFSISRQTLYQYLQGSEATP
jgi:helix-turn-helix resolvase-like protein